MCVHAKSRLTLCHPGDSSPPGSSVHGILQARTLEWVAMPSSRGSSQPRDQTQVSYVSSIGKRVLYYQATWEAIYSTIYMQTRLYAHKQYFPLGSP